MVLLESSKMEMGTPAPDFLLTGTDGQKYSLGSFAGKKLLVIVFMCNHCPYVQAVLDRLIAIQTDYSFKRVRVIGINPNDAVSYPDDNFANMVELVNEKGINFVYLRDESQDAAKAYGAQCTPDIFVYDGERKLVYHGRIDDNWREPENVTRNELRDALDALLEGGKPAENQNPSMGCSIKW
ncbi:MAG: thioredoxin family protein [Patescibacteria group bacterium]